MISNGQDLFEFPGIDQATDQQKSLSRLVIDENEPNFNPTLACGLDAAYTKDRAIAVAAAWSLATKRLVETAEYRDGVSIDYKPGFFGFREAKLLVGAVSRLRSNPDVFLVDGHGKAHPRRFGLACHVGLGINKPTIGVAKKHFYGTIQDQYILDTDRAVLGKTLTGKKGKTCFVSVGNKISLDKAVHLVKSCAVDNYPVPLRIAHKEANRLKESLEK